jgi:hypothetical protein
MLSVNCFSQTIKKTLHTKSTSDKITVDAKPDEQAWQDAEIATNFVMIDPDNGKPELDERKTEVKIVYDNEAIYVFAKMFQPASEIKNELTVRDNFVSADHFGVLINGYNDGQQDFRFYVSAAGVQQDCVYTESNGEDYSWNAIWDSHVAITDYGWAVEMKIPYAALRFPSTKAQTWGLNLYREVRSLRQSFTWNLINNKINNEVVQAGILEGIENIETPTRLFLIPYVSQYINANDYQKTSGEFKAGLDVKYGINDAFTLDAILVPDFGQTKFDNVILNLGPFEQQFNENRPFFTEGTELFSKGNLVYSRRIGESISTAATISDDEEFIENPSKVNLLNALKISGRTKGGLGIGVLNAITEKTEAIIKNNITGQTRKVVTEPLANYNIIVLDQRFRKNSSVSLVNTNVTRNGEYRDANVSAFLFDLNTKENTFNLSGDFKYSYINEFQDFDDRKGFATSLYFGETSGKYRFGFGGEYISDQYDINDMGILFQNHYHATWGNFSYRILNPNKNYNTYNVFNNYYLEFDNRTGRIQACNYNLNVNSTTKKNDYIGYGLNFRPVKIYDFYEPRSLDERRFLMRPENVNFWFYLSTNYNRKFAVDFNPSGYLVNERGRVGIGASLSPRYRFSNKFTVILESAINVQKNDRGYIDNDDTNIFFAQRNITTFTNTINSKYTINNVMNLNLAVRHYWSYAKNNDYLTLQDNGDLLKTNLISEGYNRNLALWNLDLSYSWWFAPGSQLSLLYRNNAVGYQFGNNINRNYMENLKDNLNNKTLDHVLSLSVRYFIDYNSIKHWIKK